MAYREALLKPSTRASREVQQASQRVESVAQSCYNCVTVVIGIRLRFRSTMLKRAILLLLLPVLAVSEEILVPFDAPCIYDDTDSGAVSSF
jgi:hypothetical protein